ncbi:MAG TPA: histidine phosphatase [Geobacteraceae bacterium]|nr:histidine phosphatase [Geobacteraceae bacterium]
MKLILIRHAAAIICDKNRYLTTEGREFFRKTAHTMLKNGTDPSLILTSSFLRAVQTADILAESLSYVGPLMVMNELNAGFDMPALRKILHDFQPLQELVVVGQEPEMSSLTAALLSLPGVFDFKRGAAVNMKINPFDLQEPVVFKWMAVGKKLIKSRKEAFAPYSLPH